MMPAKIDPPASPATRLPTQRAGGKDRDAAPAFDDALREQESAPADAATDAPPATADVAHAPFDAAPTQPPAQPNPMALEALIAQVLPQQQPAPPVDPAAVAAEADRAAPEIAACLPAPAGAQALKRAPAAPVDRTPAEGGAPVDGAPDLAIAVDADAADSGTPQSLPAKAQDAPGQSFRAQRDAAEAQDQPQRGASPFAPANGASPNEAARGRSSDQDDAALATRSVAVRKVATATHFPVTSDPVRQIANVVARAIEAPAAPAAPADAPAAPIKTVNVQLEPESLGTVTLRMRLSGNQLSVRVDVAEPATLEMIQRDRDRLQKTMASGGVSIDRLDILPAREAAPVQGGDNANAPKQDMSSPGQQSRQNGASHNGEQRGGQRSQEQSEQIRRNGQEYDSSRGGDSRGLYL